MPQLWLLMLFLGVGAAHDPLVVDTSTGKLRGYWMTSRSGRRFLAFAGVPFAKPPVGPLRFQPPAEAERWRGIRNATEHGPLCSQYNTYDVPPVPAGVEDCLYLSVYTHKKNAKNAVLVHFHGGGFISGNGARLTQPEYLMDKDVVIVDVNYRVGFLGFFCMGNKEMPGNQGLKDQVMALQWVQRNIAKFGGDPDQVTIVGESAGAGSVYHHTVSPMSKGLFHKAIAESGTSYNPWAVAPPEFAKAIAQKLARSLGCPDLSTSAAVSCLRALNASVVQAGVEYFRVWQIDTDVIWPCLEPEGPNAFLPGPVSKWKHNPVPFMMGTTSGEGLLRTGYFLFYNMSFEWLNEHFEEVAPVSLMYSATASNPSEISRKLREYYFPGGVITEERWFNLTQMYTDSWFAIGIIEGANRHTGDVYFYYLDYIGKDVYFPSTNCTLFFGAPHTNEINFLWKRDVNWTLAGEDLEFSINLVNIWTDFAKYGNPAPRGCHITWSKWNPKRYNYLEMSRSGEFIEKEGFAMDRFRFWKSINYRDKLE